jgi:hypothetical protein
MYSYTCIHIYLLFLLVIARFFLLGLHQAGSIISSLLSMAWSMASYQRSIRFVQEDKDNISWGGTVMQFLWHFMVTGTI